jgi:uncharacterized protein (DUF433 family)
MLKEVGGIARRIVEMPTVTASHVAIDTNGVAWIDDTNVKVIEVVRDKLAHDSTPEEMHVQYPHLSVAQIYAALAYYHDHRSEFDAQMARDREDIQTLRAECGESPGRAKLRSKGDLA